MPNCDFYANKEDHSLVLDWLFASAACSVYELASDFERPLLQFHSAEEVLYQFDRRYPNGKPWNTVRLQLYVIGAGPSFIPRRIELNAANCGGAKFRYVAEGWGLIQLYLSVQDGNFLANSHTNHNSEKRAQAWSPTTTLEHGPDAWDFSRIYAFSSSLNRHIRKVSAGRLGGRPVLPGASRLWEQGFSLLPYVPSADLLQIKRS